MKPQTFMNESGRAAGAALRFYKWQPEEVLVIYDDVSIPLGALRFRIDGRACLRKIFRRRETRSAERT